MENTSPNNLVYVYEEQLRKLIADSAVDFVRGVAFEWKGEHVFHVHTSFPKVAPSGYPSSVFFKIETDKASFENCRSNFQTLAVGIQESGSSFFNSIIGIFLFLDKTKLCQCAFRKSGETMEECEVKFVPEKSELYSRSKGLLEVDILENKNTLIIGLGSFGSQIAVELAKAGVGNFTLVDFDRIELSNISRHICGVNELGRFKTFAMRDAILVKNPFAKIETCEIDINENRELLMQLIQRADLVICATDNNRSRFNINEIAFGLNKTVLFGRAVTRAEGGDIFRLSGHNSPCYCCLIGENDGMKYGGEEEITSRKQATQVLSAYNKPHEIEAAVQVGLSSDILPMCNMMVKLALVELSKGLNSGISSLEGELTYDYYFWANRREKNYLNYQPFNNSKMQPTILKWFGAKIPTNPDCFLCSTLNAQ
jgi:molybdopterin/thiamine biosynthesis adenylyltransferase